MANIGYFRELLHTDEIERLFSESKGIESVEVNLLLAISHLLYGIKKDTAIEYIDRAYSLVDKLDTASMIDLAFAQMLLSRYDEAQKILIALYSKDSENPDLLLRLSELYIYTNEIDQALQKLDLLQQIDPYNYKVVMLKLRAYSFLNDKQTLKNEIEKITKEILFENLYLFSDYFRAMAVLDRADETEHILQEAIDKKDINKHTKSKLLLTKVELYIAKQDFYGAEAILKDAIKEDENSVLLLLKLASLFEQRDSHIESIAVYNKMVNIEPKEVSYQLSLAKSLIGAKALKKAFVVLQSAKNLTDTHTYLEASRLSLLALIEHEKNDISKAIEIYQDALNLYAKHIPSLQGMGHMLLLQGETSKAIEVFNKLEEISPMSGFVALSATKEFPKDKETLVKIENMINTNRYMYQNQSLLLALGSAWESNKEYKKAFELVKEANELEKLHIRYKKEQHTQKMERVIARFSKNFVDSKKNYGDSSKKPVFVLGMPRSGTTLVEQMLGGHAKVFAAGELGIVPTGIRNINMFQKQIGSKRVYPECLDELTQSIVKKIAKGHIKELNKLATNNDEDMSNIERIIDKLPHNFENIGYIKLLFPNAKIIHCRRSPEAIALSNYFTNYAAKHSGMGFAYDLEDIGWQIADHHHIMDHWHKMYKGEIFEIRYESLVEDPEKYAKEMLKYLELEWDENVLNHTNLKRSVKTASVWQVRQPVYKTSKEKWHNYKEELEPFKVAFDESLKNLKSTVIIGANAKDENELFNKSLEHFHNARYQEAEKGFRTVLARNSEHSGAIYVLGILAYASGHNQEALELYDKVAKVYAKSHEYHYNVALVLCEMQNFATAKISLKRALKLKKDYKEAMELLKKLEEKL
jgi:tetratricopeptide (TPR) repeat protein